MQDGELAEQVESKPHQSLALLGKDVAIRFGFLLRHGSAITDDTFSLENWKYQFERYSLWADNLGLYHFGHSSLDYRLREAESLQSYIRSLLSDLIGILTNRKLQSNSKSSVLNSSSCSYCPPGIVRRTAVGTYSKPRWK
jgi:hypothetical protein